MDVFMALNILKFFLLINLMFLTLRCSTSDPASPVQEPVSSEPGLKDFAGNIQIGVRVDHSGLFGAERNSYREVFEREFNSATVTCYPAWNSWTGLKQYDLQQINDRINYLEELGKTQMLHLLVAPDQYFPEWFKDGTFTNEQLDDMLHDWIKNMITSNDNDKKVEVWNVVNESLSWSSPYGYTGNKVKWHQLGFEEDQSGLTGADKVLSEHPVYLRKAFEYARQYTDAKLELRDSGAEFPSGHQSIKYKTFYQLTKHLLNSGVPLAAVGFQVHLNLDTSYPWTGLRDNIARFKALGLDVYLTEIDIGDKDESWNTNKAAKQKIYYNSLMTIALDAGVDYIHFWGLRDGQDRGWRTNESPLLFDQEFQPKPAYEGVLEALQEN
jgi:endo-1,4-beta-xylanase